MRQKYTRNTFVCVLQTRIDLKNIKNKNGVEIFEISRDIYERLDVQTVCKYFRPYRIQNATSVHVQTGRNDPSDDLRPLNIQSLSRRCSFDY